MILVHDVMGRVMNRTPDAGSALPSEAKQPVIFTYTSTGQRKTMSDASGVK